MYVPRCPYCRADLRKTGVREHGYVAFEIALVWDSDSEAFAMRDEPLYGDCSSLDSECRSCGRDLPDHPDTL